MPTQVLIKGVRVNLSCTYAHYSTMEILPTMASLLQLYKELIC